MKQKLLLFIILWITSLSTAIWAQEYHPGDMQFLKGIVEANSESFDIGPGKEFSDFNSWHDKAITTGAKKIGWNSESPKRLIHIDFNFISLPIDLDVSNLEALENLQLHNCGITSLVIGSKLTKLEYLSCMENQLQELNLEGATALTKIFCFQNLLTTLEVSHLSNLEMLLCDKNQLQEIKVAGLTNLNWLSFSFNEIKEVDLSGLENLKQFECMNNKLTSLDELKDFTHLEQVLCDNNELVTLDIRKATNLNYLQCNHNKLEELYLPQSSKLKDIRCNNNQLKTLDVTNLTALETLWCQSNQYIKELNISNLVKLSNLSCWGNQLTKLDTAPLTELVYLYCSYNELIELEITSTKIEEFQCHRNRIPFSKLPLLTSLTMNDYLPQNITHPLTVSPGEKVDLSYMVLTDGTITSIFYNGVLAGTLDYTDPTFTIPQNWSGDIALQMTHPTYPKSEEDKPITYKFTILESLDPENSYTVTLETAPGIECNYGAGQLNVSEGDNLYLSFKAENPTVTASDILFLVDGVEKPFKNLGEGFEYTYTISNIAQDHSVIIALSEYPVSLPYVEEAMTNPVAGIYKIAYGDPFTFDLTVDDSQDINLIKVYTNGIEVGPTVLRSQTLTYTIEKVTGPVEITIEGVIPTDNITIGNTEIKITTENARLRIDNEGMPTQLSIYGITGKLYSNRTLPSGTTTIDMPQGFYIVQAGGITQKVIVNK